MMTKKDAWNLLYSLHAAIATADITADDNINLKAILNSANQDDAKYDLPGLLNAGLFGLDCLKQRLEIIACLLKDNNPPISKEYVTEDYYDTRDEELIIGRCLEIIELCSTILRAERASNALIAALSSLDPKVFK